MGGYCIPDEGSSLSDNKLVKYLLWGSLGLVDTWQYAEYQYCIVIYRLPGEGCANTSVTRYSNPLSDNKWEVSFKVSLG